MKRPARRGLLDSGVRDNTREVRRTPARVASLRFVVGFAMAATTILAPGCVERTARIQTRPPGALVTVNDEEVGVSPAKFSFLWYGDYDIILRKPGYETLKTHYRIDAPWYQWAPFDLIAETLVPTMIKDEHVLPTFELQPAETPSIDEVVQRAAELRDQAVFEGE